MSDLKLSLSLVSESDRFDYIANKYHFNSLAYNVDGLHDAKIIKLARYRIAPILGILASLNDADHITKSKAGKGAVVEACFQIGRIFFPKQFANYLEELGLNETVFFEA